MLSDYIIGLDGPTTERNRDLQEHSLNREADRVFYMIQEMEAWFIGQSEVLDHYYKDEIARKLPKRPAHEIPEPAKQLEQATSNTQKGKYHNVKDDTALLQLLDGTKLMDTFEDFKRLVETLKIGS